MDHIKYSLGSSRLILPAPTEPSTDSFYFFDSSDSREKIRKFARILTDFPSTTDRNIMVIFLLNNRRKY